MCFSNKNILRMIAGVAIALVGAALYMQHVAGMAPCPLCIMQRYALIFIALFCLLASLLSNTAQKISTGFATLSALAGVGVASWHAWVIAHPTFSCGIDPLEEALNQLPTTKLFPFLFQADGLCTTAYTPILGLSIVHWSLLWLIVLALTLSTLLIKRLRA